MQEYMLISVFGREILTERFESLADAQKTMHEEMVQNGKVPEEIFDGNDEYENYECGFGEFCAWANDGVNHDDCDWLIVQL